MFRKGVVAGSGVLFFVFFFMLLMVFGGIVGGVYAFYGKGYDNKYAESEMLLQEIRDCLENEKTIDENFDIIEKCRLNKNVLESEHLVLVKEKNGDEIIVIGVRSYEEQCKFKGKQFPKCASGSVSLGDKEYEILVGSNQQSRRVLA